MFTRITIAIAAIAILASNPADAQDHENRRTLAYWNFGQENLEVSQGRGEIAHDFTRVTYFSGTDVNAITNADETENAPAEPAETHSLALVGGAGTDDNGTGGNNGKSVYFRIHTTGHHRLNLSLAARRSSTGFRENHLAYSLDNGRSFTPLDESFTPETKFEKHEFDLSETPALDDRNALIIRITFTGATHPRGNNRLDNIHFTATPLDDQQSPPPQP